MTTAFRLLLASFLLVGAASLAKAQNPEVAHNTWTSAAPMPTPVYYPATGVLKNEIYIVGGGVTYSTYTADTQIYDTTTNTWSTGASFPTTSVAGAAAVVKNILYVIGGYNNGTTSNTVWAYSPKTKTWTAKAPMPTLRYGAVPVVE